MAIELISKIKQKNNGKFFLVDAADIDVKSGNAESSYPNTSLSNYLDDLETVIGDENSGMVKDITDLQERAVPVPSAEDSGKYLRVNAEGEWEILNATISGGGGEGGGGGAASGADYIAYKSTGNTSVTVPAANNTIFDIQDYDNVTITIPSELDLMQIWECYFYIRFSSAKKVTLTLPAEIRVNGDSPSYVKSGDVWEISLNKHGGAVCLRA